MNFVSAVTTEVEFEDALKSLIQQTASQAGDNAIDLMVVFATAHFSQSIREIIQDLLAALKPGLLVGCTAEAVVSRDREIENEPAITLIAAQMPEAGLHHFRIQPVFPRYPGGGGNRQCGSAPGREHALCQ